MCLLILIFLVADVGKYVGQRKMISVVLKMLMRSDTFSVNCPFSLELLGFGDYKKLGLTLYELLSRPFSLI